MYFSDNPSDRQYEKMMVCIPNFRPRGHGVMVFGYATAPPPLQIIGTATHRQYVTETLKAVKYKPFQRRLIPFLKESEMNPMRYKNEKHREVFTEAIRKKDKKDFALMAALYLLTADLRLWNLAKHHVSKVEINFAGIKLASFEYDYNYQTLLQYFDVRRTLSTRKGVCYDFANLFAALCRSQNIPCYVVDGTPYDRSTEDHTWNRVYYDGCWWDLDVTNDISCTASGKSLYGFRELTSAYASDKFFYITNIY